jgi:hypothetical protein
MIARLDSIADKLDEVAEALPASTPKREERIRAAKRRSDGVRELKSKTDLWVSLVEHPFELPKAGQSVSLEPHNKSLVWAFRGVDLFKKKFANQPTFAISIRMLGDQADADENATREHEAPANEDPEAGAEVALVVGTVPGRGNAVPKAGEAKETEPGSSSGEGGGSPSGGSRVG